MDLNFWDWFGGENIYFITKEIQYVCGKEQELFQYLHTVSIWLDRD